jgi:integron integrase
MLAVFAVSGNFQVKVSHRMAGQASRVGGCSEPGAAGKPPRLLDQARARMRRLGLARRTEEAYVSWIRRFILSQGKRHPRDMGAPEVEAFLTQLAVRGRVAASTQNQALAALLFLYREVLGIELPWMTEIRRAKRPRRLPTVLSREEVSALLGELSGVSWLMASLLYGSGLRLLECLRLRVQDLNFAGHEIVVRQGKGGKDRHTILPASLNAPLEAQVDEARRIHKRDLALGFGAVWLPDALARKYPNAAREWVWQYVFPASKRSLDPRDGVVRRHHLDETVLQRAVKSAAQRAGLGKRATCHGTRSPRTCWKPATTSARFRNCLATRTSARRRFTRMCLIAVGVGC